MSLAHVFYAYISRCARAMKLASWICKIQNNQVTVCGKIVFHFSICTSLINCLLPWPPSSTYGTRSQNCSNTFPLYMYAHPVC